MYKTVNILCMLTIVIYKDIDTVLNPHCIEAVQSDFDRIIKWCRFNELTMNVKKTKAQFFPRNRNLDLLLFKENYALNIDNINIGYTDTFRYLGVEIQSNLLFKAHTNRLNKNASHKLFLLRRLRHVLTTQASILVLKSMFLGVLDYGLLFVSNFIFFKFLYFTRHKISITILVYILHLESIECQPL